MKKLFVATVITVIYILCFGAVSANAYSEKDKIAEILNTNEGKEAAVAAIEQYYSCGSFKNSVHRGISGDVEISEPFAVPLYNAPSESLINTCYEMYSLCYNDEKVIGLLKYVQYDKPVMDFYLLPDNFSYTKFSIFTYGWVFDEQGNSLYGGNPAKAVFVADETGSELVYLGKQDFKSIYNTDIKTVVKEEYPDVSFSELSNINLIDENIPMLISVSPNMPDIPETFSCMIVNAKTNTALTYDNGKWIMREISSEIRDKQLFDFTQGENGYTISANNDSYKKLKTADNSTFNLCFSYFGKPVCRISGADGNVLKIKNNKLTYGKLDSLDLGCEWVLILC